MPACFKTETAKFYGSTAHFFLHLGLSIYNSKIMTSKAVNTGTVTRADLAEALYIEIGLSRSDSAGLVESVIGHVSDALLKGENVKLAGFGTFLLREKSEWIGRNPKTGVEVAINPRRVLVFKPSQVFRARVDSALSHKKC